MTSNNRIKTSTEAARELNSGDGTTFRKPEQLQVLLFYQWVIVLMN